MAGAVFEAYYAPGLGLKYAVRSWIITAVVLAVGVPVVWFTYVENPQWWILVVLGLAFAFPLLTSLAAALRSPAKWGADGRLAVRIDDAGLTLPRVGTLTWDEIKSITITDTPFMGGNAWVRTWAWLTGSSINRCVAVRVKDAAAFLARMGTPTNPIQGVDLNELHAIIGVWGDGLRSPGWAETVAAVHQAAINHGVQLRGIRGAG